jgi:hypothetical protein
MSFNRLSIGVMSGKEKTTRTVVERSNFEELKRKGKI